MNRSASPLVKSKTNLLIKNKYREADYHDRYFLRDFNNYRDSFKKEIKKKLYNESLDNKDTTFLELKNSFEKKNYNQKRIEIFYKKFEVNLRLRKRYNKNLRFLTKEETSFQSYIYLGLLIIKLKRIDIFQKLNIILKLLDKLAVNKRKYKYYNYLLLSKLILIEEKLIKKILKS